MQNFWDVFAAAAVRFHGNIAVEVQRAAGLEQVTYAALKTQAEAIAAWLAAHGVTAGERCAILADNDARWCAVYLAMLRIGAVAVPLDTNYSAAQVATVLNASATGSRRVPATSSRAPEALSTVATWAAESMVSSGTATAPMRNIAR